MVYSVCAGGQMFIIPDILCMFPPPLSRQRVHSNNIYTHTHPPHTVRNYRKHLWKLIYKYSNLYTNHLWKSALIFKSYTVHTDGQNLKIYKYICTDINILINISNSIYSYCVSKGKGHRTNLYCHTGLTNWVVGGGEWGGGRWCQLTGYAQI